MDNLLEFIKFIGNILDNAILEPEDYGYLSFFISLTLELDTDNCCEIIHYAADNQKNSTYHTTIGITSIYKLEQFDTFQDSMI